mmetsp:Transcript_6907/g.8957  ORF Transcript_6907/g.8957 Transcript_6907/m.8957 type:complete len:274 (-) Transcript_6907:232-1053(-)|eukprot:CAMPEP_0198152822 /NCGR_PEP_ID=MMETSP1443-20131203/61501_1 /TAXON_ID=186043 /ORGANISM="Entomoneis sp., Strain CCMP2396" /LENGTH=273 /DNA_ID=CAMNT_0043818953 /DNA_START=202 /DNA_END=1023 /DNA_ORIENTATION=+
MTRYQVSFWATDIKFGGCFSGKPNCYGVLEDKDGNELGRTETLEATLDPDWVGIIFVEADEGQFTPLTVNVYHETTYDPVLIGKAVFEATEVNQATGHEETKSFVEGTGQISLSVVKSNPETNGKVTLQFRGLDIRNIEPGLLGLGRSDPFFEISKKTAEPVKGFLRWNCIYRSEVVEDHLNPFWAPFEIGLEELCDGDMNALLRIEIYDARKGSNRLIGGKEVQLQELEKRVSIRGNADRRKAFEIFLEETTGGTTGTGLLCLLRCDIATKG